MNEQTRDKERVGHILDCIKDIRDITRGVSYDHFTGSIVLKLALVKLIEIIGEAANKISNETKLKYSEVKWREVFATRHILVHDYNIINYDLLWEIVMQDLNLLESQMQYIYNDLNQS